MNGGFVSEAQEVLDEAKLKEDLHENVGYKLATLARKEEESETETEALAAAREQHQFLLSFAEAYFIKPSPDPQFEGIWRFPDGIEATSTWTNDELEIQWSRSRKEHTITADIQNRGARVTKYSRQDEYYAPSLGDKGFSHLSEDIQRMEIMVLKGNKHSLLTLERQ